MNSLSENNAGETPAARRAALLTAAGFALLPWLQLAPVDFERGAALLAFGPALLVGAGFVQRAWLRLSAKRATRWFAGAATLWLTLSVVFADQPAPAAVQGAQAMLLALLALLVAGLGTEAPRAARSLWWGLFAGALSGVASVAGAWAVNPNPREARPELLTWLYPHLRHIGLHLLPAALAAPVFAALASTRIRRAWALGAATILLTGIVWAGGRMPLLALGAGAIFAAWLTPAGRARRAVLFAFGAATAAGFAASTLFWNTHGNLGWWRAIDTVVAADNLNELSSSRLDIWRACLPFAADAPLLGHGPDGYRFLMPKMDGQQPHNVLVQTALAGGAPALLLFFLGAAALIRRATAARPPPRAASPQWIAASAMLAGALAGGLFDGTFYHLLSTSGVALAAGLLLAPAKPEEPAAAQASGNETARASAWRWLPLGAALWIAPVFALHLWVFRSLLAPVPPSGPEAWPAPLVRAFPSTTIGLHRWLDAWTPTRADAALEWARWAQRRSAYAWTFHAWAANELARQGRREEALAEAKRWEETQPEAFRRKL